MLGRFVWQAERVVRPVAAGELQAGDTLVLSERDGRGRVKLRRERVLSVALAEQASALHVHGGRVTDEERDVRRHVADLFANGRLDGLVYRQVGFVVLAVQPAADVVVQVPTRTATNARVQAGVTGPLIRPNIVLQPSGRKFHLHLPAEDVAVRLRGPT